MKQIEAPEFANETEEAQWWFENQDVIADAFKEEHGLEEAYLVIDKADADRARENAKKLGTSYEAYMAQLVHRALQDEAA
jgi:hypothetical protein